MGLCIYSACRRVGFVDLCSPFTHMHIGVHVFSSRRNYVNVILCFTTICMLYPLIGISCVKTYHRRRIHEITE